MSLLIALASAAPLVTTKELRTGSRLERSVDYAANEMKHQQAILYERDIGECIVRRQGGIARRVVAASNDGAVDFKKVGIAPQKLSGAMSVVSCMELNGTPISGVSWRFNFGTLRSLLVGALYRATYDKAPDRDWSHVVAIPVPQIGSPALIATNQAAAEFGECIARADFAAADRFVRAEPYSKAENEALGPIKFVIPNCLDAGAKVSLKKDTLRCIVADAVWRLATGADTASNIKTGSNSGA